MPRARVSWWMYLVAASFWGFFCFMIYADIVGPEAAGIGEIDYTQGSMHLLRVIPEMPLARAGVRDGDRILTVDGRAIRTVEDWFRARKRFEVDRPIDLEMQRDGARFHAQMILHRGTWIFGSSYIAGAKARYFGWYGNVLFMLAVACLIFFYRGKEVSAAAAALALAGVVGGLPMASRPYGWTALFRHLPAPVAWLFLLPCAGMLLVSPASLVFGATFPRPLFRKPATLWLLCAPAALLAVLLILDVWPYYDPPAVIEQMPWREPALYALTVPYSVGVYACLVTNYRRIQEANDRRRIRSLIPAIVVLWVAVILTLPALEWTTWFGTPPPAIFLSPVLLTFAALLAPLAPVLLAYAILKERMFDISIVIRQGVQYAVAKGFLAGVVPVVAGVLVLDFAVHREQSVGAILGQRGWLYAVLGAAAFVAHKKQKEWTEALDRRFFRERYNAQQLLRQTVEEIRESRTLEEAGPRIVSRIEAALHPEFVALLVREAMQQTYTCHASVPAGLALPGLAADSKLMAAFRLFGKPLEISLSESGWLKQQLPHADTEFLRQARIDLMVPVSLSATGREALLALGQKKSEEPYGADDQDLLVAIGASLALLLEKPAVTPARARTTELFEECPQCGACYDSGAGRCAKEGAVLAPMPLPRLLADRYRMERRIGRGGMGTVYEAMDTALERRVAAKVIRDDLVGSVEAAERFRREARAAASFAHPNVVIVFDFGSAGTRAFLVMELLDGTSLRDELRRRGRLSPPRVVEILRGVTSAMDAAHRRQILHRDLKPENIFLVRGETGEVPKVLDFGVAKFLPTDTQVTRDTDTGGGLLVGTPRYMSPEQLHGEPPDPAWDLWALGVVAYEMLTGAHPFPVATPAEFHSAVLAGRFIPVTAHLAEAPGRWQQFFELALASERQRRPRSAGIFFSDLARALT